MNLAVWLLVEGNKSFHLGLLGREVGSELGGGVGLSLLIGRGSSGIFVGL